jgi:hypothetical protein
MDISFVLDGWSYLRNPGRIPGRPDQRFPATATATSKSGRGQGPINRTSQPACAGLDGPLPSAIPRPDEPLSASYQDFLSTQPPLFHKADEPLDADAWLRTIESKFVLLSAPCSDENKALFVAQQLRGTARLWWDHFHAMQLVDHVVTWDEFRTAFRAHHIPEGLIERKLNEFLNLT